MAVSPSKHMRPKDAAQEAPQSETMLPDTVVDVITRVLARLEAMDARARQLQSSVCDVERAVHASNSMLESSMDEQRSWAREVEALSRRQEQQQKQDAPRPETIDQLFADPRYRQRATLVAACAVLVCTGRGRRAMRNVMRSVPLSMLILVQAVCGAIVLLGRGCDTLSAALVTSSPLLASARARRAPTPRAPADGLSSPQGSSPASAPRPRR